MGVRPDSLTDAERSQRARAGRASGAARAEKGNPAQELRLADLQRVAESSRTKPPDVDPGFAEATVMGVVKKAAVNSTGGWSVLIEVPYADAEAFFPVTRAIETELVVKFLRKPTARRQKAAAGA